MVGWKVSNFIKNRKWKIFYKIWFDNLTSQTSYFKGFYQNKYKFSKPNEKKTLNKSV